MWPRLVRKVCDPGFFYFFIFLPRAAEHSAQVHAAHSVYGLNCMIPGSTHLSFTVLAYTCVLELGVLMLWQTSACRVVE